MQKTFLAGLEITREQLVQQFMMAKGSERADILTRILDLDEEIEKEKTTN